MLTIMDHLHNGSHPCPVSLDSEDEMSPRTRTYAKLPPAPVAIGHRSSRRKDSMQPVHPKPPLTPINTLPSSMPQNIPNPLLPSAPASPPTPAPSPTPHHRTPTWHTASDEAEDPILRDARLIFSQLAVEVKRSWLTSIIDTCDNQTLSFLHHLVSPRLKKDPFGGILPIELCFKVCTNSFTWSFMLIADQTDS